jgi:hypothetical protein
MFALSSKRILLMENDTMAKVENIREATCSWNTLHILSYTEQILYRK